MDLQQWDWGSLGRLINAHPKEPHESHHQLSRRPEVQSQSWENHERRNRHDFWSPQESILGPLLFNEIFKTSLSDGAKLVMYANDLTYVKTIICQKDLDDATQDLQRLYLVILKGPVQ